MRLKLHLKGVEVIVPGTQHRMKIVLIPIRHTGNLNNHSTLSRVYRRVLPEYWKIFSIKLNCGPVPPNKSQKTQKDQCLQVI